MTRLTKFCRVSVSVIGVCLLLSLFLFDSRSSTRTQIRHKRLAIPATELNETFLEEAKNKSAFELSDKFVSCDRARAKEFLRRHGHNGSHVVSDEDFQQLRGFFDVLNQHGAYAFLCEGTLLGWYRECDIIKHTTDIDLCMPVEQYSAELQAALFTSKKFKLFQKLGRLRDSMELKFWIGHTQTDLFMVYTEGNYTYLPGMNNGEGTHWKTRWYYPRSLLKLCNAALRGIHVLVPCDTKAWVESQYGKNWFVPSDEGGFNAVGQPPWTDEEWKGNVLQNF